MSYFTPTGTTLIARRGYGGATPTGLDGVLDKIGSFLKGGASAAIDVFKSSQQNAGAAAAYQQIAMQQQVPSGPPSWLAPVAIGAGALVVGAIVLSKRKRRNPSRRHGKSVMRKWKRRRRR